MQATRDFAREELRVIEPTLTPAPTGCGRPRDAIDHAPTLSRARRERVGEPRNDRARVAVLDARDEFARETFVREQRSQVVDERWWWRDRRVRQRARARVAHRAPARSAPGAYRGKDRADHHHTRD